MQGMLLNDRYLLTDPLGSGGFADVWRADDARMGQPVAVKLLKPYLAAQSPVYGDLFLREINAVAALNHRHIVPLTDRISDGSQLGFVMPLLHGDLAQRLAARDPFDLAQALALLQPIAAALDFAHAAGYIHRDVKPSNILFDANGTPLLADFGVVKFLHAATKVSRVVLSGGRPLGTAGYMAPEQIDADLGAIGAATDVFALAAVLVELLTGAPAFPGDTDAAVTYQLMHGDRERLLAPLAERVAADARAALANALSQTISDRPASAGALIAQLQAADRRAVRRRVTATLRAAVEGGDWPRVLTDFGTLYAQRGAADGDVQELAQTLGRHIAQVATGSAPLLPLTDDDPQIAAVQQALAAGQIEEAWLEAGMLAGARPDDARAQALVEEVGAVEQLLANVETEHGKRNWQAALAAIGKLNAYPYLAARVAALRKRTRAAEAEEQRQALLSEARGALRKRDWRVTALALGKLLGRDRQDAEALALQNLIRQMRQPARAQPPQRGAAPLHIEWCVVPAGALQMGSNRDSDEKPIHDVLVAAYRLARTPVTNAQYRRFIDAGGYTTQRWWTDAGWAWRQSNSVTLPQYWNSSTWNGDQQPVVGVSWYEAVAFCRWATDATGEAIRLPTEAEWEWAARGPDGRTYPWGDEEPTSGRCNFNEQAGERTTPVGQYSPAGDGPFGHADLAGNVWEWCSSLYVPYRYVGEDGRENLAAGGRRVVRGGAWDNGSPDVRSANRDNGDPDDRYDFVGFRLAQE